MSLWDHGGMSHEMRAAAAGQRPSSHRELAEKIVRARKALTRAWVQREMFPDSPEELRRATAAFDYALRALGWPTRAFGGDELRVVRPANRRIQRTGVLAAFEWSKRPRRSL